ncbi:MAG: galactokinase [Phycisphaerales bacterium]|jgi:galactokinase|nr:galactokinase [Phycisphaerales bacterium]
MTERIANLKKRFAELYASPVAGVVSAPGRVNLIGEHTDYNDGFVLPIAIDRCTLAVYGPGENRRVNLASLQQEGDNAWFDLDATIEKGSPKWANYPKGVAAGLVEKGVEIAPMNILFDSDVPIGGGLSSSASLEVATALAMLGAADREIDDYELALICQKAEHDFAGTPCGIMDQAISVMGQAGKALLLDCRDGAVTHIPFDDPGLVLLVVDTKVKHDLTDGGYAARRDQCYSAAAKLGVKMLRDADADMLASTDLSDKELMRARHVVSEIARTLQGVDALNDGDYATFGKLMYASHKSLRDDYEVSCEELDEIVAQAAQLEGVYGARMTGGGFGGCAIILAQAPQADNIAEAITKNYTARFGFPCVVFATRAAGGGQSETNGRS